MVPKIHKDHALQYPFSLPRKDRVPPNIIAGLLLTVEGLAGCDYIALIPYKYCRVEAANALVHVTRTSNAEKAPDMTLEC